MKCYARSPEADATLAGDRAAIYHRETRNAITLNPSGTVLWQAMDKPLTTDELVAVLHNHWPSLEEAAARDDVGRFLAQLAEHELLVER